MVSISPLGYASVWQERATLERFGTGTVRIMPWQTWPHIASGNLSNEIWIDIDSSDAQIRVNRELMWRGSIPGNWQQVGVWSESFAGAAVVDIQRIQFFSN